MRTTLRGLKRRHKQSRKTFLNDKIRALNVMHRNVRRTKRKGQRWDWIRKSFTTTCFHPGDSNKKPEPKPSDKFVQREVGIRMERRKGKTTRRFLFLIPIPKKMFNATRKLLRESPRTKDEEEFFKKETSKNKKTFFEGYITHRFQNDAQIHPKAENVHKHAGNDASVFPSFQIRQSSLDSTGQSLASSKATLSFFVL